MFHPAIPVSLLALAAPALAAPQDSAALDGVEFAQLSIHERIVIRVPRMMPSTPARQAPPPVEWREHKGPKCVAAGDIAGVILAAPGGVDLLTRSATRLRAKLDGDCRSLDYYNGFYIRPAADGMICRDRDAIRVRSGAKCDIDEFKTLKAKK